MEAIEEKIDLDWNDTEGNVESVTSVALVKRGGDVNIFDILNILGCSRDNRWENAPERIKQYRATNLASYRRSKETKSLHINIDVGCWHSYDCCGCLCRLSYEITLTDRYYVIIRQAGYNC